MEISFSNIDLLHVRNKPISKKNGKAVRLPDFAYATIVRIHDIVDGRLVEGYGEIRTSSKAGGQGPVAAYKLAGKLARRLRGQPFDVEPTPASVEALCAQLRTLCREVLGVRDGDPIPMELAGATLFGFDCAIIDFVSKAASVPVGTLIGAPADVAALPSLRTRQLSDTSKLIKRIMEGQDSRGWLRGRFKDGPEAAAAVISGGAKALAASKGQVEGVIFNLEGRWQPEQVLAISQQLQLIKLERKVQVRLEDPFPGYAVRHYTEASEGLKDAAGKEEPLVRILTGWPLSGTNEQVKSLLSSVDLKLSPQGIGGFFETLKAAQTAKKQGFKGTILLENPGDNGCLGTAAAVALSAVIKTPVLFETTIDDVIDIRTTAPQGLEKRDDGSYSLAGLGWGVSLCASGLKHRLLRSDFVHEGGEVDAVGRKALKEGLKLFAIDDLELVEAIRKSKRKARPAAKAKKSTATKRGSSAKAKAVSKTRRSSTSSRSRKASKR